MARRNDRSVARRLALRDANGEHVYWLTPDQEREIRGVLGAWHLGLVSDDEAAAMCHALGLGASVDFAIVAAFPPEDGGLAALAAN